MKTKKAWTQRNVYQILFGDAIVPAGVPLYYRIYLLLCKSTRSIKRQFVKEKYHNLIEKDVFNTSNHLLRIGETKAPLINKTFTDFKIDLERDDVDSIVSEISKLKNNLSSKGLRFTSAAGSFKSKDYVPDKELIKTWENAWILTHAVPQCKDTVLDLGGASTIFSFYLGSRGCRVYCIDNDWGCSGIIYNTRYVAKKMKWPIKIYNRDLAFRFPFKDNFFDKVFCICVLEHLGSSTRQNVMRELNRVLKPGGLAGFTFDYDVGRNDPRYDKGIRYMLKETFLNDILLPAKFEIVGNQTFLDDCPPNFFLGTLFLKKL